MNDIRRLRVSDTVPAAPERSSPCSPTRRGTPNSTDRIGKLQRTGQEVHSQVQPGTGPQQVLHLLVGLRRPERRVEPDRHQLGNR